jgi:polar amino acid transport system substrate-binding protein
MRKYLVAVAVLAMVAAACAPEDDTNAGADASPVADTAKDCAQSSDAPYTTEGMVTIATGNPAYEPWYGGKSDPGSEWKSSSFTGDPHSGDGFEGAFAYALAQKMGFEDNQLDWIGIPFNKSFAPGPKDFDFAMQQISYSDKRAQAVDFSDGYFDVNQALIADDGSPAIGATTLADLKDLKLGAPIGTTSLQVIQDEVQPNVEPAVYDDLDLALRDLKNGQIDGVVVDYPTAFYGYADVVVGQFPALGGEQEHFSLAFEKGNTLVDCVNLGIQELKDDGTLQSLQETWLTTDVDVPVFSS